MAIGMSRPMKGARISDFYPVKQVPPLASIDSAFQLQEYISLLIRHDVHDVETIVSIPGRSGFREREGSDDMRGETKDVDKEGKSDVVVDEFCWIYEQLRRLAQDLSHPLITTLQQECTRATCPEMKAGEWMYLCVAHGNDGSMEQCCAIDYILHTLDSATALLNSPRAFPSRLSIPPTSQRHFPSLARRLGRIFAHAYYHHREAFEQAEAESSLYARFLALTSKFELVPTEFLVIPSSMQSIPDDISHERGRDVDMRDEWVLRGPSEPAQEQAIAHMLARNGSASAVDLSLETGRGLSPPSPANDTRNPSPRKGRSRTDTMVFSEAANVAEELAKNESFSEADIDKAIAQERIATAEEPSFEEPPPTEVEGENVADAEDNDEDRQATIRMPENEMPREIQTRMWEMMQGKKAGEFQGVKEVTHAKEPEAPLAQTSAGLAEEVVSAETAERTHPAEETEEETAAEESLASGEREDEVKPLDEVIAVQEGPETKVIAEAAPPSEATEEIAQHESEENPDASTGAGVGETAEETIQAGAGETHAHILEGERGEAGTEEAAETSGIEAEAADGPPSHAEQAEQPAGSESADVPPSDSLASAESTSKEAHES